MNKFLLCSYIIVKRNASAINERIKGAYQLINTIHSELEVRHGLKS